MLHLFLLGLLLLPYLNAINWEIPTQISSGIHYSSFGSPTMISDPNTLISHVFYCHIEGGLRYFSISAEGAKSKEKIIRASSTRCYALSIVIQGNHLYVAEGTKMPTQPDDIYFMESYDNGVTWSPAILVPRDDMSDNYRRAMPSLAVSSKGKVYIVYVVQDPYIREDYFVMVKRDTDTSKFINETRLEIPVKEPFYPKLSLTEDNGQSFLHLIWTNNAVGTTTKLLYSVSSNDGVDWSASKQLANNSRATSFYGTPASKVLVLAHANLADPHYVVISKDNGNTWASGIPLIKYTSLPISSQCRVSNGKVTKQMVMVIGMTSSTAFGMFDLVADKYEPGPSAFDKISDLKAPSISCHYNPTKKLFLIRAIGIQDPTYMYYTQLSIPQ